MSANWYYSASLSFFALCSASAVTKTPRKIVKSWKPCAQSCLRGATQKDNTELTDETMKPCISNGSRKARHMVCCARACGMSSPHPRVVWSAPHRSPKDSTTCGTHLAGCTFCARWFLVRVGGDCKPSGRAFVGSPALLAKTWRCSLKGIASWDQV